MSGAGLSGGNGEFASIGIAAAMLQAQEAVAEAAVDPRNTKAAKLTRANSIMKALDDVGNRAPVTSWQKRAAASSQVDATHLTQAFASLPRPRTSTPNGRRGSAGSDVLPPKFTNRSQQSIGRATSDQSWIMRSLRVSEEAVKETELDPRNKRRATLSRKESVLNAMKHLNISLEDLHEAGGPRGRGKAPLQRSMSKSMGNMFTAEGRGASFKQLNQIEKQRMGLWGSMKRVKDVRFGSGKRLVEVLAPPADAAAHSGKAGEVVNMLPAALGIFQNVARVMEALLHSLAGLSARCDSLDRTVQRLRQPGGAVAGIEASLQRIEAKLGAEGGAAREGGGGVSEEALEALAARVAAVESKLAAQRPGLLSP